MKGATRVESATNVAEPRHCFQKIKQIKDRFVRFVVATPVIAPPGVGEFTSDLSERSECVVFDALQAFLHPPCLKSLD